jgi:cation transport regulator ChaC
MGDQLVLNRDSGFAAFEFVGDALEVTAEDGADGVTFRLAKEDARKLMEWLKERQ